MDIKKNILETIGNTPMVRINSLNPNPDVNIFAKLEGFNPSGSIKDRIAVKMVNQAEKDGAIVPCDDLPKAFVLTAEYGLNRVHLTALNSYTLEKRLK